MLLSTVSLINRRSPRMSVCANYTDAVGRGEEEKQKIVTFSLKAQMFCSISRKLCMAKPR
jgi:hypothetical protein